MAQKVSQKAAQKAVHEPRSPKPGASKSRISYKDAGVSIDEADRAVASIRTLARKTFTSGVLTDIGSFGGGFLLKGYREPVLVSSADGVGTKLKLAFLTGTPFDHRRRPGQPLRQRHRGAGRRAAVLHGLFRSGQTGCARGGRGDLRHRARLQGQRLRADRRRDGRDARASTRRANTIWRASSWAPSSASAC